MTEIKKTLAESFKELVMEKRWGDSLKAEERKTKQQNREVTVQWMR